MDALLPAWPLFGAFLAASVVLAVTPGPGVLFVVTRTVAQGRRCGLISVAGVALGNLVNALGASIGLAAIFAVSAFAFTVVKVAGACYLLVLGIQMLRASDAERANVRTDARPPARHVFRDGFAVALLNPKTTLFYAAFLPQFVAARDSALLQTMLLASIFVAIAAVTDALYALGAAWVATRLRGDSSVLAIRGRRAAGALFVALGLYALLARNDPPR